MRSTLLIATAATLLLAGLPGALRAQEDAASTATAAHGGMSIPAGTGKIVRLKAPAANVFSADPKVLDVRPANNNTLFIFGLAPGRTNFVAIGSNGETVAQYDVVVTPGAFTAEQTTGQAPITGTSRKVVATPTANGMVLSGHVATPADAEAAVSAAKNTLPPDSRVDNRLSVPSGTQVSLRVRVAEMRRSLTRDLGINWNGVAELGSNAAFGLTTANTLPDASAGTINRLVGGVGRCTPGLRACPSSGYSLNSAIDALAQDGLVQLLAEPNLTTLSGEPASFLVGGEYPVPVASDANTVSVSFKQFGVSLTFVPTVVSKDKIVLHVRPEVSEIDPTLTVTSYLGAGVAVQIPGLRVRRADTTVELGSGQSFAIAGLLSDQASLNANSVPGIGEIPMIGALFRSDGFLRRETELVITVTPYIVQPVDDPGALKLPTDGWHPPTDLERILFFRQAGRAPSSALVRHIPADAGFVIE